MKTNLKFTISILFFAIILSTVQSCRQDDEAVAITLLDLNCNELWSELSLETQLIPNTLNVVGVEQEEDEDLNISCTYTTYEGTSSPHESMMTPNPASATVLPVGMITTLEGLSGSYPELLANTGGNCTLILNRGVHSEAMDVPRRTSEILPAITELQANIPPGFAQSIDFTVYEVHSLQQAFAKIGFSGNGPFYNFASQVDYSSYDLNHKYIVTGVVHDFSVKVEHPSTDPCVLLEKWSPNATSAELGSLSNIPVYVEQANYGKLLLMTIESNSSHLEVEAMLEASFGGLFNDFDVNFDAGYNELLSESNISIQAIGGSLDWIVDTIPTTSNNPLLNWLETVAFDQTGMTAAPLFIQMAFLDDGSNANVVLATDEYIVRECIALPQQYVESIDLNNFRTNDPCNPGQHNPFEYICPIHVGGDRDFGGECNQTAKIELVRKNNNTELWVEVYFQVIEPNPDYTEGEAFVDQKVFTAPPGYFISSINSDHYSQIVNFYDDDHSVEIHNLPSGELVNKLIINGDNEGKDIRSNTQGECNCQQDPKAYLTIDFNQVDLTLREF